MSNDFTLNCIELKWCTSYWIPHLTYFVICIRLIIRLNRNLRSFCVCAVTDFYWFVNKKCTSYAEHTIITHREYQTIKCCNKLHLMQNRGASLFALSFQLGFLSFEHFDLNFNTIKTKCLWLTCSNGLNFSGIFIGRFCDLDQIVSENRKKFVTRFNFPIAFDASNYAWLIGKWR